MTVHSSIAIQCKGVTKSYGTGSAQVMALRGIDLEVRKGELLMLVGPSGCGKTTLISVVAGILNRDGGECVVFDHDFAKMRDSAKTKFRGHNIGFVFQAYNLIPSLTAAENVAVPLLVNGKSRQQALARAKELLERVGMADKINKPPTELSGGQQQRVAIARAMVHNPKLIVCDEPTSALDHETGHHVMDILREVALGPDRALVIVTHDARIFEFADRIAKMDDGHIVNIAESPRELDL